MATIRERNGTYQITVYSGFDLNGRRKRETTTFTPPKELSPKKKEKVVQAFAIDFENRVKNGLVLAGEKTIIESEEDPKVQYSPSLRNNQFSCPVESVFPPKQIASKKFGKSGFSKSRFFKNLNPSKK